MKLVIKLAIASAFIGSSSMTLAQWTYGGGYSHYDELGQGLVYGSLGYQYELNNMTIMPEFRLGVGVGDDTQTVNIGGQNRELILEIDNFISASLRGQYSLSDSVGVFLQPSFSILEKSITDDSIEFTMGAGVSFKATKNVSIEALYESIDSFDALSIGLRFSF